MKFKKILATVGSVLMLSSVIGGAFAAGLPTTLKADNTVIVQGTGSNDANAISTLQTELAKSATQGAVSVSEEGSYKLERSSDKFNIGENATAFLGGKVSKDELPSLLADGVFKGKDNKDYKYTQTVQLNESLEITHFKDSDYKDDVPVLGMKLPSSRRVAEYKLDFISAPGNDTLKNRDISIMGKNYFILDWKANEAVLLDAGNVVSVDETAPKTIEVGGKSYTIEVENIYLSGGVDKVKLSVNGITVEDSLEQGDTYKLPDNSYIGVKEIIRGTRERDTSSVELSIGSGKIELRDRQDVKSNDKTTIRGLKASVTLGSELQSLGFIWELDKDTFLSPGDSSVLTLPLFENLKIALAGINFPAQETIKLEANAKDKVKLTVPIKDGTANIDLAYLNQSRGNYTGMGKSETDKLVTGDGPITLNITDKEKRFLVSWASTYEGETYYLSVDTSFDEDDKDSVTISNVITGEEMCSEALTKCKIGNTVLTFSDVNATTGNQTVTLTSEDSQTTFKDIYSKEGMKIIIPNSDDFGDAINNTFNLNFTEENKDGALGAGKSFNLTVLNASINSENKTDVKAGLGLPTEQRIQSSDDYEYYLVSDLATKVVVSKPNNAQGSATVTYHGSEVSADVYVTSSSAISTSIGEAGKLIVADTDAAKMSGKNLIVVGGSAINSVAARLLGFDGPAYGEDFTEKTGVSAGEYLIQSFDENGKVAIVVAGYNAADTENGAKFLALKDYVVGKKYKGTTADVAQEVTA